MSPRFSLRRSLCALLVAVAAIPSFADLSSQQLQNLLNSIGAVYDILNHTQNNQGLSTAWYLQNIRDIIRNPISDLQTAAQSQTASLASLDSAISDISTLVASIEASMSDSPDIDFSDITTKLDDIYSAISSYSSYVSSIDALLSSISSSQVTSADFGASVSNVLDSVSSITTYQQLSSLIDGLTFEINAISARLDSTLDVSGDVEISSTSFAPVVNAVGQVRQKVLDFQTNFLEWYVGRTDGHYNEHTWIDFANKFDVFLLDVDSLLTSVQWIYSYLKDTFQDQFTDVWTNTTTYLPYLTNQYDDVFLTWFSNQVVHIPVYPSSPSWNDNPDVYRLSRVVGMILAQNYGLTGSKELPSRTSILQVPGASKAFFTSGTVSPTPIESSLYSWSEPLLNQRRWMYEISNTVPYIEGLPYRKSSLSESGDGWLGSWGNYNWNTDGDTISLIEDSRQGAHTPWNNQYFSTDYFADLLKFIARTNLLQDAAYYNAMLALLGATNSIPSEDIEEPDDLEWTEPTDVQATIDELPDSDSILPTDFTAIESREYESFVSDASSKLRVALDNPVSQISDSIVLFPSVPSIRSYSSVVGSPELLHFEDYMTASDRRTIHDIFAIMWRLIYYVFAVWKVTDLIKTFFAST